MTCKSASSRTHERILRFHNSFGCVQQQTCFSQSLGRTSQRSQINTIGHCNKIDGLNYFEIDAKKHKIIAYVRSLMLSFDAYAAHFTAFLCFCLVLSSACVDC